MDIAGSRIWITGASSGIGAALATELDRRGARVAISARRRDRLEEVAAGRMHIEPLDVSDTAAFLAAGDSVRAALGGLDVAVFAAGQWGQTKVDSWDPAVFAQHFDTNLMGLVNGIAAVMPAMIAARSGTIVGVASVAGYRGIPQSEAYGATKAAQINMLEALRAQLAPRGVHVQTVCPGFVKTELTEHNTFPMPFIIEAAEAARAMADGIAAGKAEVVFPVPMMLLMKAARLVPVSLWSTVFARVGRKAR